MRLQSSYSRHVPWADEEPGNFGEPQAPQSYGIVPAERARRRKLRSRRHAPITFTAGLLFLAGLGAGGLMFSDRLVDVVRDQAWMEPSAGWMALFNDKPAIKPVRQAKVDNAVLRTPAAPLVQEQVRRPDPGHALAKAANSHPTTTSSFSAAQPGARDLAWLPEPETRAEPPEPEPAPAPSPLTAATPEPAPIKLLAAAPEPAPVQLPAAAPAPAQLPAAAPPEPAPIQLPAAAPAPKVPSASEVAELIRRARDRIDLGDIAGARLLLERAAAGSDPSALMALAETYDPAMLSRWRARGIKGHAGRARELYQKAAESGLSEARARILALR